MCRCPSRPAFGTASGLLSPPQDERRLNMNEEAILARLIAQAEARGGEIITLRALVEEASEAGAARALGALGLDDPRARRDMDELRALLSAWRDAKRSAWRTMLRWIVQFCCAALLFGMAMRFKLAVEGVA